MKTIRLVAVCLFVFTSAAFAQQLKFPPELNRLAARASEVVDVTMDRNMLNFASKFMSHDQKDQEAQKVISKLNGIYVKSFEFKAPGEYSPADVQLFRSQLKAPLWSKMIETREHDESVEIYFRMENGAVNGLAIIAAERRELTLVHIDGPINPDDFVALGGQFGIPRVHIPGTHNAPGRR